MGTSVLLDIKHKHKGHRPEGKCIHGAECLYYRQSMSACSTTNNYVPCRKVLKCFVNNVGAITF